MGYFTGGGTGGGGGSGTVEQVNGDAGPNVTLTLNGIAAAEPTTADVALNGHKLTGLADPASAQDAATRAFVLAQITTLIAGAPGALDTLNELATALGDDANFATTVTNLLATKAKLLTRTAPQTANYTAVSGDLVPCDTTSAPFTVTLPAAATGAVVAVKLVVQGATNAVTVACAGSDTFNRTGGGTTASLTMPAQGLLLIGAAGIWTIVADDLPLGGLDLRYLARASAGITSAEATAATDLWLPPPTNPDGASILGGVIRRASGLIINDTYDQTSGPIFAKVAAGSNGGLIQNIATWSSPSAGVLALNGSFGLTNKPGQMDVAVTGGRTAVVAYAAVSGNTLTGCTYVSGANSGDTVATNAQVNNVGAGSAIDPLFGTPLLIQWNPTVDYNGGTFGPQPYTGIRGVSAPRAVVEVEGVLVAKTTLSSLLGLPPIFQNAMSIQNDPSVAAGIFAPEGFVETPTLTALSQKIITPGYKQTSFAAPGESQGWHIPFWAAALYGAAGNLSTTLAITAASYSAGVITYTVSGPHNLSTFAQVVTVAGITPSGFNVTGALVTGSPTATTFQVAAADPGAGYTSGGTVTVAATFEGIQEDGFSSHLYVQSGAWVARRFGHRHQIPVVNANAFVGLDIGFIAGWLQEDGQTITKPVGAYQHIGILNASATVLTPDVPQVVADQFTLSNLQAATSHLTLVAATDTAGSNVNASTSAPVIDGPWAYDVNPWHWRTNTNFSTPGDRTLAYVPGTRLKWRQYISGTNLTPKTAIIASAVYDGASAKTDVEIVGGTFGLNDSVEQYYGLNGQLITLINGSVNASITFTSGTSPMLKLVSSTRTLPPGGTLTLLYNPTVGAFCEIAASTTQSGTTVTAQKNGSFTMAAGDYTRVSVSSGNATATLPTSPADGTICGAIIDVDNGTNNICTINAAGSDKIQSRNSVTATAYVLAQPNQGVTFKYQASTSLWVIVGTAQPGPFPLAVKATGGNYTVGTWIDVVRCTTSTTQTITLPDVTTVVVFRRTIKNKGTGVVTVAAAAAQTVEGAATFVLQPGDSIDLIADAANTNWDVV